MNRLSKYLIFISLGALCFSDIANAVEQQDVVSVDNHPLHVKTWDIDSSNANKPTVVMISGPIDSWHSDTAWFAGIAPKLAKTHKVITIDRAGLVLATPDAPVGYDHFADDLAIVFTQFNVKNATLIAFASSNISAQLYLNRYQQADSKDPAIARVILIDPDALTPYSSARYAKDAKPFKDNLADYLAYVSAGKYSERVAQKNAADKAQIEALLDTDNEFDWRYTNKLFAARLIVQNQLNLFNEIARYDQDLASVMQTRWPNWMPVSIIDTDFELHYVDNSEKQQDKEELLHWREDAANYYQTVATEAKNGRYIHTENRAHLFHIAEPNKVIELINDMESKF